MPDLPLPAYRDLLMALEMEFTYNFRGCTVQRGLSGRYLSQAGQPVPDRINLIHTDTPYTFTRQQELLSQFADELRIRAAEALEEEAILVAVFPIYHSGQ